MKKITQLKNFVLLLAAMIASISAISATQYCHTPLTASDGVTVIYLSTQSPAAGQYEIKIESDVEMAGLGGSFANVNGAGGYQLNLPEHFTLSADKKTITIPITSTVAPSVYTPLYVLMPGEKVFSWPADVEWGVCSTTVDEELPTAFTAVAGTVGFNSIELLLNASDNSGLVVYEITYGTTTLTTTASSGVQKSYIVSGLTATTEYSFSVKAKDAAGNVAANSPIVVTATTTENTNNACAGVDSQKSDGDAFVNGYAYNFTTTGNDVVVTFELLDTKVGLVAFLWNKTGGFAEVAMTHVEGQKYSATLVNQTPGAVVTVACKFAFAGGMSVTRDFEYKVGDNCSGTTEPEPELTTIDFETVGQDWEWTIFENGDNAATLYAVVANPAKGGINTSDNVGSYTVNANGQPWAGLWSANLTDFTFTADNCIVKVMVYKEVLSPFTVKFENADASVGFEKKVSNTVINQWEELTFDFSDKIGMLVTKLVLFPDFPEARTAGSVNYFDNISFSKKEDPIVVTDPLVAAAVPTKPADKVISLFSGAYTNVAVSTWRTDWSNAGFAEVMIDGNATLKYTDMVFVGAETTNPTVDASAMTHLHLDVWTPDMSTLKLKLVDFGADGAWSGGDDVEHELTFEITLNQWNSLDIDLTQFTGLTTRAHLAQYIFSGTVAGKLFVDNVYFYDNTTAPEPGLTTIDYETVGQDWAWTLFENGDNDASLYAVVANPAKGGINISDNVARYTVNANGQPWAGLWSNDLPDFTFTADNCIVKVLVNKDVISPFALKFENDNSSVAFEKKIPNTVISQWEELTYDFSDKIGTSVTRLVIIPDFPDTRTVGSTNYWDNISFSKKEDPIIVTDPVIAAPTPEVPAEKVISMFSGAYENVAVDTWRTDWSNASFAEVMIDGNPTLKYTDLVFVGAETTQATINATEMTHVRLDVWTPDMTTFKLKLVDFGANGVWGIDDVEHELSFALILDQWNTLDIDLNEFTGLTTRANMAQYIFSGTPTGKVFIDNLFFYDATPTSTDELNAGNTIGMYPNPVVDQLRITSTTDMNELVVRNLLGQMVKTITLNGTESSVDLSTLNSGNYLVTLRFNDGSTLTKKIQKQ